MLTIEQRKQINEKFSYLANSGELLKTFSKDEVMKYYTGKGGLHGLEFKNFDCFHNYTKAKQEAELGAFFTPDYLFDYLHEQLKIKHSHLVADLTFGKGGFFNKAPVEFNTYGCELDVLNYQIATALFPKSNLVNKDFRNYESFSKMDLVFGNPPFNLRMRYAGEDTSSQFIYIQKSFEILKQNGILVLLVPNYYLSDEMMHKSDRNYIDKRFKLLCQYKLPLNTFAYTGVACFETKIMFLQKLQEDSEIENINSYDDYISMPLYNDEFYSSYIAPLYKELDSVKSKILNNSNESKSGFEAGVKKLLFDIRRNPKTSEFYAKCYAYYEQYINQKQPEGMKYEEWEKIKITAPKVIRYLKDYLAKQNPKKVHPKGTLIKGHHCLKEVRVKDSTVSINDMVYFNTYPFDNRKYRKLISKKRNWFENESKSFDEIQIDNGIHTFLKDLKLKGFDNGKIVDITLDTISPIVKNMKFSKLPCPTSHFNVRFYDWKKYRYSIQIADTNKVLQKQNAYLQWEQGSGKTISGLAQIKYRQAYNSLFKSVIVGPSIAIEGTWKDMLKINGFKNLDIKTLNDVNNIASSNFDSVTINFYYLNKYKKQIKKQFKNKKIFFILDEADNCSNNDSIRTKAILDVFRKSKYKCIMSGTSVRNNIPEFFPQLELMYNNSILMMDRCAYIYKEDPKDKEIKRTQNKNYNKPFRPFKKGHLEFRRCFNPSRATVFGVTRQNQEIYNSNQLADILDYSIITRSFEEVTGKKIYKVEPLHLIANEDEQSLEESIKKEIHKYYGTYINSTGNSRKDAILRLLHQMRLLFKASSNPKTFKEYSNSTFTKYEHVKKYLSQNDNYYVVAGTELDEVCRYKTLIGRDFPDKNIFYIDGSISMAKRKSIIEEMSKTKNSVLICTQQSLSSSISINFIDKVLLTSLDWNLSKMSQFYFRFIRYNSLNFKNVNILTIKGSIESNLLKLVIDKDSLVNFMKTKKISKSNKLEVNLDLLLSFVVDRKELKTKNKDDMAA